jgi:WD40 repeat protein
VWEPLNGSLVRVLKGHKGRIGSASCAVYGISFSDDGFHLISSGNTDNGTRERIQIKCLSIPEDCAAYD